MFCQHGSSPLKSKECIQRQRRNSPASYILTTAKVCLIVTACWRGIDRRPGSVNMPALALRKKFLMPVAPLTQLKILPLGSSRRALRPHFSLLQLFAPDFLFLQTKAHPHADISRKYPWHWRCVNAPNHHKGSVAAVFFLKKGDGKRLKKKKNK